MYVELVVLTKSSKHKGYCVAGIDIRTGQWIRLTSDDESTHGALFPRDMRYRNGTFCQVLDVIQVQIMKRNPSEYQPENVLIDRFSCWKKTNEYTIDDVLRIHPPEGHSFIFGNQYPYVTEHEMDSIGYSLTLVIVENLSIVHKTNSYGKPKTKADFSYGPILYRDISVTDPAYYKVPDQTQIGKAALVISLPDSPFPEDRYYKFIAQIYRLS